MSCAGATFTKASELSKPHEIVEPPSCALAAQLARGRICSLDGLRALSISLVLGCHTFNAWSRASTGHDYTGFWSNIFDGGLGVSVFFVISGFLITHLLLKELKKTGRIDLVNFYIRRTFRIWPAFFAYLGAVVVLRQLGIIPVGRRDLIAAALFVFNYVPHVGSWWVGHSWSLSVEEQFYLVWPALLLLVGRRRGIGLAAVLLVMAAGFRWIELRHLPWTSMWITRMWETTHTRMDGLMCGGLLALLADSRRFGAILTRCFDWRLHWVAAVYLCCQWVLLGHLLPLTTKMTIGSSIEAAAITLIVAWAISHPETIGGRFLNWGPLVHVGRISYSLYLWQQLFLVFLNRSWTGIFPLNLLCAFAMAEASHYLVEQPFLRLRERWFGRRLQAPSASRVPVAAESGSAVGLGAA